jgi:hypothetical protein
MYTSDKFFGRPFGEMFTRKQFSQLCFIKCDDQALIVVLLCLLTIHAVDTFKNTS